MASPARKKPGGGAGLMREGFSPEKEKAPFQERWKGAVTGSGARP